MEVHVRSTNIDLSPSLIDHVERSLGRALDRFAHRVSRIMVVFSDINGPNRHGVDTRCNVVADLGRSGTIVVEHIHEDAYAAADLASGRLKRAVRRRINRRRDAALRSRRGEQPWPAV